MSLPPDIVKIASVKNEVNSSLSTLPVEDVLDPISKFCFLISLVKSAPTFKPC